MRIGHLVMLGVFIATLVVGGFLARWLIGYHDERPILESEHLQEPYVEYNALLEQYATPVGMRHKQLSQDLLGERVYSFFAHQGPTTSPDLFPTDRDKLAYDINAYNALVHILIARNWPIDSPLDIRGAVELTTGFGFFQGHRFIVDGQRLSLIDLDHRIVQSPAYDPRVRLVMACGGKSCPFVQAPAFEGDHLDEQLNASIQALFKQSRTVVIDEESRTIQLLPVILLYQDDLQTWLGQQTPPLDFQSWWTALVPEKRDIQRYLEDGFRIESQEIDWHVDSAL